MKVEIGHRQTHSQTDMDGTEGKQTRAQQRRGVTYCLIASQFPLVASFGCLRLVYVLRDT